MMLHLAVYVKLHQSWTYTLLDLSWAYTVRFVWAYLRAVYYSFLLHDRGESLTKWILVWTQDIYCRN